MSCTSKSWVLASMVFASMAALADVGGCADFRAKDVRNKLRATIPPQAQALCFDGEMLSVRAIQMPKEPLMLSTKSLLAAAIALLVTPFITPAQAQSWPTRSVRFIVPFGPGAGADI